MFIKEFDFGFRGLFKDNPLIHPFTVFSTRSSEWMNRKKVILSYGIKSEIGRESGGAVGNLFKAMNKYDLGGNRNETENSIFDPVLCELLYSWLTKEGDSIIDPFAGGSVRGILAGLLKRKYYGIDLNGEQITENIKQLKTLEQIKPGYVNWKKGDSLQISKHFPKSDLMFTCPPYFNLEKYSDLPEDLSNMDFSRFSNNYCKILEQTSSRINNNRFLCVVISNIRDKNGFLIDLVGLTIKAFEDIGIKYYNELILVNSVGSLPIRLPKQFANSRKFGKVHQNILIFVKGCPKEASKRIEEITCESKTTVKKPVYRKSRDSK